MSRVWEHYGGSETTAPNGCRIATGFDMGLKKRLRGPAEGEFLFEIDETPLEESLTSFGGLPLFLRAVCAVSACLPA